MFTHTAFFVFCFIYLTWMSDGLFPAQMCLSVFVCLSRREGGREAGGEKPTNLVNSLSSHIICWQPCLFSEKKNQFNSNSQFNHISSDIHVLWNKEGRNSAWQHGVNPFFSGLMSRAFAEAHNMSVFISNQQLLDPFYFHQTPLEFTQFFAYHLRHVVTSVSHSQTRKHQL